MNAAVSRFLDYLQFERGMSANTCKAYAGDLAVFVNFLQKNKVDRFKSVTRDHIVDFLADLQVQGQATSTRARRLVAVKMLLRYLVQEEEIPQDVTAVMSSPKLWRELPEMISPDEIVKLLGATGDSTRPHAIRDNAILELFYACGLRVSELASLKMGDIQADTGFLRCQGKGSKQRVVPIGGRALDALGRYLTEVRPKWAKYRDEARIFISQQGRGFSRQGLYQLIVKYAKEAGLKGKVTPHTLRHCFASHLLANGADLRSIQEMLGHADIATTQIYTHVDHQHLMDVHRRFHPRA
jgi:integrase/recombinase XerD